MIMYFKRLVPIFPVRFLCPLCLTAFLFLGQAVHAQPTSAEVFNQVGIDQKLGDQIPLDLKFKDEQGNEVPLGSFFGSRPVVLSLVYYNCPMLCTEILNGMVETFRTINFTAGKEFEVVTVSIDPTETSDLAAEKKIITKCMVGKRQKVGGISSQATRLRFRSLRGQ
jgi:protein SCO1/2